MTFEKLLKLGPKEWQEISDDELYKLLEPFFIVTRPEKVSNSGKTTTGGKERTTKSMGGGGFASLQKELMRQATLAGIVLPSTTTPSKQ